LCSEAPCVCFAACSAWICRLRHLSFACACACLALELFVLVFVLFACGARTSSVQITLASLASVHRRRQNASNTQLFISYRSAAAPKAARISCCCWQIVWFAVCIFTAGRLRCHLVKQPLPAALDTGAGGAGVGVATRSGACRCIFYSWAEAPQMSPSVENPSGGASVAYFFYSSLLGYFENILVQPFDEGRDSLERRCLEIF